MDRAADDRRRYDEELAAFKTLYGKTYGKNADEIEVKHHSQ